MAPTLVRSLSGIISVNRLRKNNPHSRSQSQTHSQSTPSENITIAPDQPWQEVGPAASCLLPELEKLYWVGVRNELENILFVLKEWQSPEFVEAIPIETEEDFVHGFDTFIDQVSQGSRSFAKRYGAYDRRCFTLYKFKYS